MHDFNPGIMPNGLFWTMEIPANSLEKSEGRARLRLERLPIPDTFFFSNNVSVSAQIDVDLTFEAIADPVHRGGPDPDLPDPLWGAFSGEFADAICTGRGGGAETGFRFRTGEMTSEAFFAEFGYERNGVFL